MKQQEKPLRLFKNISEDEIVKAVTKMCAELNTSISSGNYSILRAVLDEQKEARKITLTED